MFYCFNKSAVFVSVCSQLHQMYDFICTWEFLFFMCHHESQIVCYRMKDQFDNVCEWMRE